MYGWIWRRLPGNRWLKSLQCLVLLVGVVALLFLVVFPWLDPRLPWNRASVNAVGMLGTIGHTLAAARPWLGLP
jgi:hypothetical protein